VVLILRGAGHLSRKSTQYALYIYTPDGRMVANYGGPELSAVGSGARTGGATGGFGLGVKSVAWSPSAQVLAVGGYDQRIRLLNHYTWKTIIEFQHVKELRELSDTTDVQVPDGAGNDEEPLSTDNLVYAEMSAQSEATGHPFQFHLGAGEGALTTPAQTRYVAQALPFIVPSVPPQPALPYPKLGVDMLSFGCNGRYMASRNDNMPTSVWIWDVQALKLVALLHQTHPVRQLSWSPVRPEELAICCGNGCVYLWEAERGPEALEIPASMCLLL
jgi:WD40 repeat protein